MNPLVIQAKWFTPLTGRQITLGVIHQQQAPLQVGAAEGTARFFQNLPANRKASAHRVYDPGTRVQCVAYKDIAYHCPGLNHNGIGFELPGYSDKNDWALAPMESAMLLCVEDLVEAANEHQFPLEWLDYKALEKGAQHGITSHWEATKAGLMGNNHTDPGVFFPVGRFMELCGAHPASHLPPPVALGKFTGGEMNIALNAGVGFVTAKECKVPGEGNYTMTADGGIRISAGGFMPPTGAWNYLGLEPGQRQGDRHFTAITPNEDGSPGWTEWGNDGTRFSFGPGKNGWPS